MADRRGERCALGWLAGSLLAACAPQGAQPPAAVAAAGGVVTIPGGDGGGLPRAEAVAEHFDAVALAAAGSSALAGGAQALLVARHGHVVLEAYAPGSGAGTPVDGGEMSAALLALTAGLAGPGTADALSHPTAWDAAAVQAGIERAAGGAYAQVLSQQLWQPLNAAPAQWRRAADGGLHADCCVSARAPDWLRIGLLLVQRGRFEGEQRVPEAWVDFMLQPLPGDPTRGYGVRLAPQGHAARNVVVLRGPGHTRLWLVPSLQLAVLRVDPRGSDEWSEPAALDPVIRAVGDRALSGDGADLLNQLVPGH